MKLRYIDAMRGLAIFSVIFFHCSLFGNEQNASRFLLNIFANGARGVQLFYIASAFTLFLSLSNKYKIERHPIKSFFIRRFFRIAPMYYFAISYFMWQDGFGARSWIGGNTTIITVKNLISNILFCHGINPFWINSLVPGGWSVTVEMMFYLLIPLLFYRIKNINSGVIFLFITLIIRIVVLYIFRTFIILNNNWIWNEYLFFYLPNQLPVFALGIILYHSINKKEYLSISTTNLLVLSIFIITDLTTSIQFFPVHLLYSFAFALLVYSLSKKENNFFVNSFFIYLGKISYSMYLVHFAVIYWLIKYDFIHYIKISSELSWVGDFIIRFIVLLSFSVFCSSITYKVIEEPFQAIGKKIINRMNLR